VASLGWDPAENVVDDGLCGVDVARALWLPSVTITAKIGGPVWDPVEHRPYGCTGKHGNKVVNGERMRRPATCHTQHMHHKGLVLLYLS
jgi:hypothetical protein